MSAEKDVESGRIARIPHFKRVLDQAAVNDDIINAHYDGSGTGEDPYIVVWLDDDPVNPMNYPIAVKWTITMLVAVATLAVAFVSSAYSGGVREIIAEFGVVQIIATLGISLFVLGFAIGPLIWAPMSELFGRQFLFFGTYMLLTAFNAGAAGANSIATLIVLRFLAGAFGSSPLTNAGGVIADMFPAAQRGLATSLFAAAPFLGPVIGPIVGGFVGQSVGWRWVEGVMAIFTGVLWIVCAICVPETYSPVLLRKRAAKLSQITGKVYLSRADAEQGKVTIGEAFKTALSRPWILLFQEPIVLLLSIYMAIIYGTLYMMFGAFPIVYQQGRGWSPGIGGLAFLGVAVGMIAAVIYSIWDNKRYIKAIEASPSGFAPPEARLPPALIGSVAMPIGLFWFAWTNYPSIHWFASIAAGAPFGFGMVLVFLSIMNYLIDAYLIFAASVLAANAVLRSLFGAAFPLFTTYMYQDLGIHWASSIPAFLALACVPFPFLFYKYGPAIRARCKYAAQAAAFLEKLQADASHAGTLHHHETEREAEREAEAIDYSYDDEEHQPESGRFAAIKTKSRPNELSKTKSNASLRSNRSTRSVTYDANPYDIDRVNTHESFSAKKSRSRANSAATKK
ncbi:major facilitator superfamily domain-containing protein [Macrophomina phaseolina]|uniref:Major facilitator superfamily domain-containing protein n=1 Tax=Macrophomina phaseolina TaxID=35725 RepID=A0ABQ8GVD1_9PEZI|nr:major facilitator superfamily domain-containing protein [Macrophomina phaseolina]